MFPNVQAGVLTWCDVCALVAYLTYLYLTRGTTLRNDARRRVARDGSTDDVTGARAANGPAPDQTVGPTD
jgi:hypothetical protein